MANWKLASNFVGPALNLGGGLPANYRTIFKREDGGGLASQLHFEGGVLEGRERSEFVKRSGIRGPYRDEQTVFIANVDLVETPKEIISSRIWLEICDEAFSVFAGAILTEEIGAYALLSVMLFSSLMALVAALYVL